MKRLDVEGEVRRNHDECHISGGLVRWWRRGGQFCHSWIEIGSALAGRTQILIADSTNIYWVHTLCEGSAKNGNVAGKMVFDLMKPAFEWRVTYLILRMWDMTMWEVWDLVGQWKHLEGKLLSLEIHIWKLSGKTGKSYENERDCSWHGQHERRIDDNNCGGQRPETMERGARC